MYVNAREGEPFEELYRRFKRGMEASGHPSRVSPQAAVQAGPRGATRQDPRRRA